MKLNEITLGSKQHHELVAQHQASQQPKTKITVGELFAAIKKSTLSQQDVDNIIDAVGKDTKSTTQLTAHDLEQICVVADVSADYEEIFDLVNLKR
jgi:hypothetical protein